MYRVTLRNGWDGQEILIHSETAGRRILKAQISKSVGAYDMLAGTIDPTNIGYDKLLPLQTFIKITRPDKARVLFEGRLLTVQPSMSTDGVINKDFRCEALESFLHDSYQPWAEFHNTTPKAFLQALIDQHNLQVEDYKKIKLGTITVTNSTDNVYRFSDDTKDTYDNIKDKLISSLGGEIRIRHEVDGLYLDYEPEISEQSNQVIRLQSNLLSITQKLDPTAIITVLKPLGKAEDRAAGYADATQAVSTPRLTVASVNNGSAFIRDEKLISQFGVQVGVQTWDDITTAAALLSSGKTFMANQKTINQQVQISAVDLSLLNRSIDDFICGNYQHIINPLMAFDQTLRIVSQSIDICTPGSSTMGLGDVIMSQEAYNSELRKQAELGKQINQRLQLATAEISIANQKIKDLNTSMSATTAAQNKQLSNMQKLIDQLQEQIDSGSGTVSYYTGAIIDVSEWQKEIDWPTVINAGLALAVIRVQDGSSHEDLTYKTSIPNAIAAGANYGVYAYFRAVSVNDAVIEANNFYNRAQAVIGSSRQPRLWMIDLEEVSMSDMQSGMLAYVNQLNKLGVPDSKIVIYSGVPFMNENHITVTRNMLWIAAYGTNSGQVETNYRPKVTFDLWQYTSVGKVPGISTDVDMNTEPSDRFKKAYLTKG